MTKVIMNGCNGKMGQTITEICKADADIKIVAGIDLYDGIDNDYPVFRASTNVMWTLMSVIEFFQCQGC